MSPGVFFKALFPNSEVNSEDAAEHVAAHIFVIEKKGVAFSEREKNNRYAQLVSCWDQNRPVLL